MACGSGLTNTLIHSTPSLPVYLSTAPATRRLSAQCLETRFHAAAPDLIGSTNQSARPSVLVDQSEHTILSASRPIRAHDPHCYSTNQRARPLVLFDQSERTINDTSIRLVERSMTFEAGDVIQLSMFDSCYTSELFCYS
ncbi:unnamed protein product [Euphydryas editha]|uniref:Uncharacterized protein n=1 Tax=Euphydryas editha TaxID=104508 RepID=A0AAU9UPN2_EUPED|nr:unnamed protein product [Euphydryas editha]